MPVIAQAASVIAQAAAAANTRLPALPQELWDIIARALWARGIKSELLAQWEWGDATVTRYSHRRTRRGVPPRVLTLSGRGIPVSLFWTTVATQKLVPSVVSSLWPGPVYSSGHWVARTYCDGPSGHVYMPTLPRRRPLARDIRALTREHGRGSLAVIRAHAGRESYADMYRRLEQRTCTLRACDPSVKLLKTEICAALDRARIPYKRRFTKKQLVSAYYAYPDANA